MTTPEDAASQSLTDVLSRLELILQEPIDFTATDTRSTLSIVRLLTAAATYFNIMAVADFGGRAGPSRDPALVEQVIGAAFQSYGDADPHPDPFDKAAMLLRGITQGHPFNDGNKRTGFLVATFYLERVGIRAPEPFPDDDAFDLCTNVSAGRLRDVRSVARELRRIWHRANRD